MNIFRLSFLLYYLKLSAGTGFWMKKVGKVKDWSQKKYVMSLHCVKFQG